MRLHTLQDQPGEYVLVSKANTKKEREKIKPMWTGPYLVKEIVSNNVYRVESLLGKEGVCHASYLWFYEPCGYEPSVEVRNVFLQNVGELEIEEIVAWRQVDGRHNIMVKWLGFEDDQNTWETVKHMSNYIPEVIVEYAEATGNTALAEYVKQVTPKQL